MNYLGSKAASGAYQAIIALMPPHQVYIETHLGSGAVMAAKPPAMANIGIDLDPKALELAGERLRGYPGELRMECADAHDFLRRYDYTGEELIYADPPYLRETRSSRSRYRHEYDRKQHIDLLNVLTRLPPKVKVMVSGYPSQLYDELLPGWNTHSFQVMTRGGVRTEKIWFNYSPDYRFWGRYAGRNYIHRQQIKRKAERWASNYRKMPPDERRAVMAALLQVEAEVDTA